MERWRVDDVLHERKPLEQPCLRQRKFRHSGEFIFEKNVRDLYREELEVAVADDVEHVEAEKVDVEHSNACTADSPCSQQGNGKVGSVHQVLHEGVHGSRDGLGNERSVMVRVVFL